MVNEAVTCTKSSGIFLYGIKLFKTGKWKPWWQWIAYMWNEPPPATTAPRMNREKKSTYLGLGCWQSWKCRSKNNMNNNMCNWGSHMWWPYLLSNTGSKVTGRKTSCGKKEREDAWCNHCMDHGGESGEMNQMLLRYRKVDCKPSNGDFSMDFNLVGELCQSSCHSGLRNCIGRKQRSEVWSWWEVKGKKGKKNDLKITENITTRWKSTANSG